MLSVFVLICLAFMVTAKPVENDEKTFVFKFDPNHKIANEFIDILNMTATLLEKENKKGMENKAMKMKNAIKTAFGVAATKRTRRDDKTFVFKYKPNHNNAKDYIDILNMTTTLLEKENERCMEKNAQKMKNAINAVFGLQAPKRNRRDDETFVFKYKPNHKNAKDYIDILNMTATLLEKENKRCMEKNAQKMKHAIKTAFDVSAPKTARRDCKDWYDNGATINGVYEISPKANTTFRAYCDMSNGGWTVIQRRENGDVSFDNNWEKYAEGFGDIAGDHWLGLRHLYDLTDGSPSQIHFRFLMTETQAYATAVYPGFYVENEAAKFRMHVDPNVTYITEMQKYVDSQYKFFLFHNNMKFTTKEQDNDKAGGNCAQSYGGFWFNKCYTINVNTDFSKMYLWSSKSSYQKVSRSEIKIRPVF